MIQNIIKKNIFRVLVSICVLATNVMAISESNITAQMQLKIDNTTELLKNKKIAFEDKSIQIFEAFDSVFDYNAMSKIALGNQWKKLSKEQKKSFQTVFTMQLKQSYIDKLNLYTDEKVQIEKIEKIKSNRIQLHTKLIGQEEIYDIVYKFHKSKNKNDWLIYDVEMIGVSIMKTYRSQFKEFLSTKTFENLLIKLKTKIK